MSCEGRRFLDADAGKDGFVGGLRFLNVDSGKAQFQQIVYRHAAAPFSHPDDDALRLQSRRYFAEMADRTEQQTFAALHRPSENPLKIQRRVMPNWGFSASRAATIRATGDAPRNITVSLASRRITTRS